MVGSLNADLVVRTARAPGPGETVAGVGFARHAGGKGGNQACAAARAAGGAVEVSLIGRVGDDPDGRWLKQGLAADGVDVAAVGTDAQRATGVAAITVEATGENRIVVIAGANDGLTPATLAAHHATLASADVLLLQLEIPFPTVATAIRVGREKRATVILDPAPARSLPDATLALVDWITPNEAELRRLAGDADGDGHSDAWAAAAAGRLLARGARRVAVKRGARGALLVGPDGAQEIPAFPVTAVDTTAAGDAWNGAFGVALTLGHAPAVAARFANAAGALAVTRPGAQPSLPDRAAIDSLLRSEP